MVFGFHCFLLRTNFRSGSKIRVTKYPALKFTEEKNPLLPQCLGQEHQCLTFSPMTTNQMECGQINRMFSSHPVQ